MNKVADLNEFRTKRQKALFVNSMKKVMMLDDYDLTFDENLDNGNMWECYADHENRTLDISFKPDMSHEEFVRTVIHEFGHWVTAKLRDCEHIRKRVWKKVADVIESEIWDREEEVVEHFENVIYSLFQTITQLQNRVSELEKIWK